MDVLKYCLTLNQIEMRGKKNAKKRTFKRNVRTMGTKAVGIVFGVPHFAIALINHELATTEGLIVSLIQGKDNIRSIADMRTMQSEKYIDKMENAIDDGIDYSVNKVKSVFTKKDASEPQTA